MNAIETVDLVKSYGDLRAVDGLSLAISQGELFALLGVNGAGKTTTIKLLSCLIRPTSGSIRVLGMDAVADSLSVKRVLNVSPQESAVAPNLTVFENLTLISGLYGADFKGAKAKAEEAIIRFDLTEVAQKRAKTLSGGWQRRLSIAMAMITEPKILFLDEPTLGLDVLARRQLWRFVESLKGKTTVILTTHYLEEAEALADRVGILASGKLVACDFPKNLVAQTGAKDFENAFITLAGGNIQ